MTIAFTPLVASLPASTPFVGPETLERQTGRRFTARIGANESAFGISDAARAAIIKALNEPGQSWYPDPENYDLRVALARKHDVDITSICVDGGIDSLLGLTVRMLVSPASNVVTSNGAYPTFNYHVAGFGGNLIKVDYRDNREDPQSLLDAARQNHAAIVYIANPDNPMGTRHRDNVIADMIDQLPGQSVLALDEAYIEFTDKKLAPPIDPGNDRVIRFRTFSKAYGMAGMRIGYAIAHPELITGMNKIRNHFAINRLSQLAASAALDDNDFIPQIQALAEEGRERIYSLAEKLKLPYLESATNFVAVDMGSTNRAKQTLNRLNDEGIFMRMPGVAPLDRYIRIGVGTEAEHACLENSLTKILAEQNL